MAYRYSFPIDLTPDDNHTLLVTFPDVPEAVTFGGDEADARRRAVDALVAMFDHFMDEGRDIPTPGAVAGRPTVVLPARIAAKLDLYRVMREEKVSKVELARRLGSNAKQVRRMLDLTMHTRFDELEAALVALGRRPIVELVTA